jgi:hypothetical protein
VVGRRGARGPAGEHVGHEGLQVGAASRLEADGSERGALTLVGAPGSVGPLPQEGLGLAEALQIGGDGALGAVLGAHVPLEGASERGACRSVHDTSGSYASNLRVSAMRTAVSLVIRERRGPSYPL